MNSNAPLELREADQFSDVLAPGTTLLHGQYVIEKFLASGGFGITYLATDSLERRVVIKECFPESICRRTASRVHPRSASQETAFRSLVDMFIKEARNLARMSHPNIVGVHQVFEDFDTAYMALDYVDGRDLLTISESAASIRPETLENMVMVLLDAIGFIHKEGILHRDIAPDNILLNSQNQPVLIDFGAARETVTRATRLLGAMQTVKDGYSPQEFYVADADQDPSSDLYSLGASLYHVITGAPPPNAQERMWAVARGDADPYVPLSGKAAAYSTNFLSCIDQSLKIFPKDRIHSAKDWQDALQSADPVDDTEVAKIRAATGIAPTAPAQPPAKRTATGPAKQPRRIKPQTAGSAPRPVPSRPKSRGPEKKASAPRPQPVETPTEQEIRTKTSAGKPKGVLIGASGLAIAAAIGAGFMFMGGGTDPVSELPVAQSTDTATLDAAPGVQDAPVTVPEIEPAAIEAVVAQVASETELPPLDVPSVVEADDISVAIAPKVWEVAAELTQPALDAPMVLSQEQMPNASGAFGDASIDFASHQSSIWLDNATRDTSANVTYAALPLSPMRPFGQDTSEAMGYLMTGFAEGTLFNATSASGGLTNAVLADNGDVPALNQFGLTHVSSAFVPPTIIDPAVQLVGTQLSLPDTGTTPVLFTMAPEPLPLRSAANDTVDLASVVTSKMISFPVLANVNEPTLVVMAGGKAREQIKPGEKITMVNGQSIETLSDVSLVVNETLNYEIGSSITLTLGITDINGVISEREVTLPTVQETRLSNGVRFHTYLEDGAWVTTVIKGNDAGPNGLLPGDRVVAFMPWNEKFDTLDALPNVIRREVQNGATQLSFAVNRNNSLWFVTMPYAPQTGAGQL